LLFYVLFFDRCLFWIILHHAMIFASLSDFGVYAAAFIHLS
jgi:hypothetical protein